MKLRNKKTGEIAELNYYDGFLQVVDTSSSLCGNSIKGEYTSISELSADWEDAPEEPKEYWGIDYASCRKGGIEEFTYDNDNIDEFNKSIGNYFETKEEAKKAVEKLEALKRLKDNNLRFRRGRMTFVNTDDVFTTMDVGVKVDTYVDVEADLDLLFSGGEE